MCLGMGSSALSLPVILLEIECQIPGKEFFQKVSWGKQEILVSLLLFLNKYQTKKASWMSGYVSHISVNDCSMRVVSTVNYFHKTGGC